MPSVVTIGNFDGVHRGHARLLAAARELATPHRWPVKALVFDPHPAAVLRPGTEPPRLSTFDQRRRWLSELGADEIIRLDPASDILTHTAEAFVDELRRDHYAATVVEGPDFHFGKGRAGNAESLKTLCAARGMTAHIVPPISVTLTDHHIAPARSTLIRWLLQNARVADAAAVLGRWYELTGTVVRGDQRGRTINCPTANIDTPHLLPADGVYAGTAVVNGTTLLTAISIGTKPTFTGSPTRTLEAHLLAEDGPWTPPKGLPEYGWSITLRFHAWLRDQARYGTLRDLTDQIDRDIARTRQLLSTPQPV